ncbi:hypothetical protein J6I90_08320 [Pseudidiomarina sp. 1APP75-32.1]|uniref:Membrane protein YkvI n=1 Tax=Pseudidiomarina terrestris TaxID=2820060 RepID=A0AAW7R2M1_9GAMM|nr:hypothetical protein [Pseudidiomarina sp. 1APP75-32.1]MDN7124885.1 hypothetical protein [Pseudidiomarina sp. 1APP75-32.1]
MLKANRWVKGLGIYLVPGLVFQSVIVGGGYGTGREIAEFFLVHGAVSGLAGMLVSCVVWGLVLAVAFEFARLTKSYNYKSFFQALLGRFWWLFEVIYLLIALLVLAVLGSAAGEIISQLLGVPPLYGVLALMAFVGILTFYGSRIIERFFVCWSALLYLTYIVLLGSTFTEFGDEIAGHFANGEWVGSWGIDGVRYAAYNLNALAAVLFVVPRFKRPRQALGAGAIAGVVAIIPGILVFLTLLAGYPDTQVAAVPVVDVLAALNIVWLLVIFQVMLFGTFIETGTGVIHAVNERIANTFHMQQRVFPASYRAGIALGFVFIAAFLANKIGIIGLIASGYGLLSYAYIAVVIVPLLTVGVAIVVKQQPRPVLPSDD